jgi:hypothetical protein
VSKKAAPKKTALKKSVKPILKKAKLKGPLPPNI